MYVAPELAPVPAAPEEAPDDTPELLSPHWPLRLTHSLALTFVLALGAEYPLLLDRGADTASIALALSALLAAVACRAAFQAAAGSGRGAARTGSAAVAVGLLAAVLAASVAGLAGSHASVRTLGATAALAVAVCGLASGARQRELRIVARSRRVFLIGTDTQYFELAREVRRRGDLSLAGWIPATAGSDAGTVAGRIRAARPTMLVLSGEAARDRELVAVASELHLDGLSVRALNDFYEQRFKKVPTTELSSSWFLFDVAEIHKARIYGKVKRIVETALALLVLLVSAPVLLVAALLVKRSSPGGMLFRQQRVGRQGRTFTVIKLRTMVVDEVRDAGWAGEHAHRITPIGRFLRRCRIDELPQLWNVVRGDLSLVGPRPEQPELVERLSQEIEFYNARHRVRPGLTGWAQVNHDYGGSLRGTLEKLQFDFFYIKHQSLRLDAWILFSTVRTVLAGGGR